MSVNLQPRGRWSALATLAVGLLLSMATWFSATAVIPQLRQEWHLGPGAQAWLTIAVQLGFVLGALVSAALNLADVFPVRRLMLCGAIGAATANAFLVLAGGPGTAIPIRLVTGAFLALVYPPALKTMATWFGSNRGAALGVLVGALTIGSASPHLVNAVGGTSWRPVILVTSALTVAGGLAFVTIYREGPNGFPRATFDPRQAFRAFASRGLRLAGLGYLGHMWELYAMWAWFSVFFADVLVLHHVAGVRRLASAAAFLVIAIGALGCVVGGRLGDRWGRTRLTALSMVISAACAGLIGFLRPAPVSVVLAVALVWGFWVIADSAQFSAMVTELADQRYVGTAVTIQLALGFTLTVVTIWLIPIVLAAVTWRFAFLLLVPGPALGAVAMLRLMRLPEARSIALGRG
ncbi:MAG: MFS transporter [Candidatus Dormibacteria bacterium]